MEKIIKTRDTIFYKIGVQPETIKKMAEFISKQNIEEEICKKVPTIESEECIKCKHTYGDNYCVGCSEFYENNCLYESCVDCIIDYFENS